MISWLKFFFGGFFVNKFAVDGAHRSVWNAVFAFVIGWALIYVGLYVGYVSSFASHYYDCTPIVAIADKLFDDNISIKVSGGKAVSGRDGNFDNSTVINTFTVAADKEMYSVDGYNVIFDTRPRATTYDDFTVECVHKKNGAVIEYETYKTEISDSAKSEYIVRIKLSGNTIKFDDELILKYKNYLDGVADETDKRYDGDIAKEYKALDGGDVNGLYELYVKAYCPEAYGDDKYGNVPTVRTYYVDNFLGSKSAEKYLAIFDDSIVGDFVTDVGLPVSFGGYYLKFEHVANTPQSGNELIIKSFRHASGVDLNIYLINLLKITPVFFIAPLLFALMLWLTDKAVKSESFVYFGETCKIVFSFALIGSVLTFLLEIALSFALARNTVYALSSVIFAAIMLVRCVLLGVPRFIGGRKRQKAANAE